jgi:iron complex transport system ATP-binding protein
VSLKPILSVVDLTAPAGWWFAALHDSVPASFKMPGIRALNVSVSIGDAPILTDVSLDVASGEWLGLIGPNGSGKSTLLRTIAGLLPYTGSLKIEEKEVRAWRPRPLAQRIGFMQQSARLTFDLSVKELVLLGRSPHHGWLGDFSTEDHTLVQSVLESVEIAHLADRSVLTLSGGELQRALLAQVFVQDTPVLLLDEPTSHLDVHHQFEFMRLVSARAAKGRTIIAVFHDLEMAIRHADRIAVLDQGRLVASGPPGAVMTSAILARVFRMDADVDFEREPPRIRYRYAISQSHTSDE